MEDTTHDALVLQGLGLLPCKALICEMAILSRPAVDGFGKVELLDNHSRPHVEVLLDDLDEFF